MLKWEGKFLDAFKTIFSLFKGNLSDVMVEDPRASLVLFASWTPGNTILEYILEIASLDEQICSQVALPITVVFQI